MFKLVFLNANKQLEPMRKEGRRISILQQIREVKDRDKADVNKQQRFIHSH
ncbi:MAG: hypothetical protein IPI30_06615 [Saprospiraceae bacterium]|nr:hypothetical protein [Candidatus Vicinibacter affinis]